MHTCVHASHSHIHNLHKSLRTDHDLRTGHKYGTAYLRACSSFWDLESCTSLAMTWVTSVGDMLRCRLTPAHSSRSQITCLSLPCSPPHQPSHAGSFCYCRLRHGKFLRWITACMPALLDEPGLMQGWELTTKPVTVAKTSAPSANTFQKYSATMDSQLMKAYIRCKKLDNVP